VSVDRLVAKDQCRDLLYSFGAALDRAAHAEAADMFAAEATAARPDGLRLSGTAVREMLLNRPTDIMTVHVLSNVLVTLSGDDSAEGSAVVLAYRVPRAPGEQLPLPLPTSPHGVGEWHVRFKRTDAGWRMSHWAATAILAPRTNPDSSLVGAR